MSNSNSPIKRSPALIKFSREHHFGLLVVWKIRQGISKQIEPARISNYIIFSFENELMAHFKEEEMDLFSKLPDDDEWRQQAIIEHERIYRLIEYIEHNKEDVHILTEFADTLESHIRFEERTLFNHLQQHLSADELKMLEESHSQRDGAVDDKWNDHFWVTNKQK